MRIPVAFLCIPLVFATGCLVRERTTVETTPVHATVELTPPPGTADSTGTATVGGTITVQAAPPPSGVTVYEARCAPGSVEQCNGLDDNCDGAIDEGCGWQSGPIQITSAWQTGADIDLYVTDPYGETISYQRRQASSGGILDHDARGACLGASDTIENVYWSQPQPPQGRYQVELHYWGSCGVAGPTPSTVSIAVGGRVIGVYNVTLQENQRLPVAVFEIE